MLLSIYLSPGDHLVSPRWGFEHHGLYLGKGRVIHYAGGMGASSSGSDAADGIECVSLAVFAQGHTMAVIEHPHPLFSPSEAIARAYRRQGEQRYHPAFNNCEHFVQWCIEGVSHSPQTSLVLVLAARSLGNPWLFGAVLLGGLIGHLAMSPESDDE